MFPDHYIQRYCEEGDPKSGLLLVTPFHKDQLQPASYDVCLAPEFIVFESSRTERIDLGDPSTYKYDGTKIKQDWLVLHPGEFILGATVEKVNIPDNVACRIEGKSTIGRTGMMVHVTAGFVDPGFRGPLTLEMCNLRRVPIKLRAGELIAQLSFEYLEATAAKPYAGKYQDSDGVETAKSRDKS